MKLKIADTTWKIRLLTLDKFIKEHGEDYNDKEAVTDTHNKIVDFRKDCLSPEVVRHEFMHMYFSLSFVASSNLTMDQTEEVCAEIIAKYGEDLIKNSRKVYNSFKKRCQ